MKNNTLFVYLIILTFTIGLHSCNEETMSKKPVIEEATIPTQEIIEINDESKFPNERSELALYMRNLYNDLKANKKGVANGKEPLKIEWALKYANLKTAKPTDSKDSGPVFEAFADKFLLDLGAFQNSEPGQRTEIYNGMIESCLSCHQEYCMGPMTSIRKLKFD